MTTFKAAMIKLTIVQVVQVVLFYLLVTKTMHFIGLNVNDVHWTYITIAMDGGWLDTFKLWGWMGIAAIVMFPVSLLLKSWAFRGVGE